MPPKSSPYSKQDPSTPASTPPLRIKQTLSAGLEHHQAGRLAEAERTYRKLLDQNPGHADALHLLGMLQQARGQSDEAENLIRRAIAVQPRQPVFRSNLGIVLAAKGKLAESITQYGIADLLDPQSPETLNNMGVAYFASGSTEGAIDCFKRAVILRPEYADARSNLLALLRLPPDTAAAHHAIGDLLHEANRSKDAIGFYRKAIEINPESAETHNNLGNALFANGEPAQALLHYQRALELSPEFPQACNNLANALKEFERLEEAIAAYHCAVALQPNAPEPLSNLGNILRDTGQWEEGMECYQKALALRPDHAPTHNNIGNAWCERGDWSAAIAAYQAALAIHPDYADAINNLGTALEETGQRDRAMECYRRANELEPNLVSPPWNIALLQLLQGDYENGWTGYENRWRQKKQCKTWRDFKQPMARNISQMKGRRILLHAEQGFGDAIQFCRYATWVAREGATVLLECPPKLARIFRSIEGVSELIPRGEPLPDFDLHCPLMSLPMIFGTQLDPPRDMGLRPMPATTDVPRLLHTNATGTGLRRVSQASEYLSAEESDIARWQSKFADEPPALRVGLVWAGQATHQKDRHRSLSLAAFSELANIPRVRFYSLQIGDAAGQAKSPPSGMQLVDWTRDLHDFADTAGLISQLDLVITVDTAVCHLAGAMGKPSWVLLAFQPDWRWLLDREDSPWYPRTKLFRQMVPGNWDIPLSQLARALENTATGFEIARVV